LAKRDIWRPFLIIKNEKGVLALPQNKEKDDISLEEADNGF
jgi:hypothetical protein